jgi:hypothetical protein
MSGSASSRLSVRKADALHKRCESGALSQRSFWLLPGVGIGLRSSRGDCGLRGSRLTSLRYCVIASSNRPAKRRVVAS